MRFVEAHKERERLRAISGHRMQGAHGSISKPEVSAVFIWEITTGWRPMLRVTIFAWARERAVAYLRIRLEIGEIATTSTAVRDLSRVVTKSNNVFRCRRLELGAPRSAVLLHPWPQRVRLHAIVRRGAAWTTTRSQSKHANTFQNLASWLSYGDKEYHSLKYFPHPEHVPAVQFEHLREGDPLRAR